MKHNGPDSFTSIRIDGVPRGPLGWLAPFALSLSLTLAAGAAFPALGQVPAPAPPPGAGASDTTAALMEEYQNSLQALGELQIQALRDDTTLEGRRSAIDTLLVATMAEIDPQTMPNISRLDSLAAIAREAQQRQDSAAIEGLMGTMMTLRGDLQAAQAEALQRDNVQAEIQRFEEALMAAVLAIDPAAAALRARIEELEMALASVLPPGGPG